MTGRADDEDEIVSELLKRKDKIEAIKWLTSAPAGVHRNVGEMTNEESVAYVRNLYKLGAREVAAVKLSTNRKYESTDTLILTLPNDPSARAMIFESETERVEEMGYDEEPDMGQRYLLCWFD